MAKAATVSNSTATAATVATGETTNDVTANRRGSPKLADRVAPEFTEVRTIPIPATAGRRGGVSPIAVRLATLEVNQSIGLTNKTKVQISSTISKINSAAGNQRAKLNADGTPVTEAGEPLKNAEGVVVGPGPLVPVMERIKEFTAFDVDPKTDPDKATVRIFRTK